MTVAPRSLVLGALSLAIGLSLLFTGITVWRDPEAINRGVFGWWSQVQAKLYGPEISKLSRLFARPTAIAVTTIGLWFMVLAIFILFNEPLDLLTFAGLYGASSSSSPRSEEPWWRHGSMELIFWPVIYLIGSAPIYLLYRFKRIGFESCAYLLLLLLWAWVFFMSSQTMNLVGAILFSTVTAGGMIFWAHLIFEQKKRDQGPK